MQTTQSPVLEMARFRLAAPASTPDFLAASAAVHGFLRDQPGFVRRSLVQEGEVFSDLVEWRSLEAAVAAAQAFMTHPVTQPLMAMIDPESLQLSHQSILLVQD